VQKYSKISTYLAVGFGLVIAFTVLIGIIGILQIYKLSTVTANLYNHPFTVSNAAKNVKISIVAMRRSMKDINLSTTDGELNTAIDNMNKLESDVYKNFDIIQTRFLGERADVDAAKHAFDEWNDLRKEVLDSFKKGQRDVLETSKEKRTFYITESELKVNKMIVFSENKAKEFFEHAVEERDRALIILGVFLLAVLILGTFISIFISRKIAIPLTESVLWIRKIEKGNFKERPVNIDKRVREILDLTSSIQSLSVILEKNERINQEQNWLKDGLMQLDKRLLNITQKSVIKISDESLEVLCRYTNASIGALYIFKENEQYLELTGGYALMTKDTIKKYALGEGIVGQVGKDKKSILLRDIKENPLSIHSSLSEQSISTCIYTFPLTYEDKIAGVVQIGTHLCFDDLIIEFFDTATDSLSSYIRASMQQEQIKRLLKETQEKNEELQSQSEELQVQAEELETQSEALQESYFALEEKQKLLKQATLEANQANQYKSEFLANMSHEIRTPMNAVLGFSELLSKAISDKKQKSYLDAIQVAGKTLLSLINDVLDLSKIEAGQLEMHYAPTSIHDVFDELQQIFTFKAEEKNIEFITDVAKILPENLMLDEIRFKQILLNLIGNALKFTDDGFVKLSVMCDDVRYDRLNLRIFIEDTGIGIPEDQQSVIFESFRQQAGQNNKKYQGTGLGLTITKRLVEKMQGSISVKSIVGKGSVFEVFLSDVEICNPEIKKVKKINQATFDTESIDFERATLLVVDDIESNRNLIKENFMRTQVQVIEAENGQIGVQRAKEFKPNVILMDIKMPVMDGYQAAEQLKISPDTRHIPIIVLTASATLEEKEKIKNTTYFSGVLVKPLDSQELFKELLHHLKFTKKSKPVREKGEPIPALTLEELIKLPELIDVLENRMLLESQEIAAMMEMDEVEDFAKRVIELGRAYHVTLLGNYGESLIELTDSFEIEDIEKELKRFPRILKKIKTLGEKHD
jgi:signal transduction histidine kinase/CheY-like chemotaxis protein